MADQTTRQVNEERQYSRTVVDLHNTLVNKLSKEIAPSLPVKWNSLLHLFDEAPLGKAELANIKSVGDLVQALLTEKDISYENYEPFAEKLEQVNKLMAGVVRDYARRIKEQINREERQYSRTVVDLNNTLVNTIAKEIAPSLPVEWNRLLHLFDGAPLGRAELANIKSVGDLVQALLTAKDINYENYEPFAKKLEQVNKLMAGVVRDYARRIKKQINREEEESIR
ncbi:uncharacterized protein LOC117340237 isoform X2 [Pecten maximus]|nr:uncharacterized protein LOC117340237 isoform X2 [Pecten maximus]XP_033757887.1 uncharacterized protein LOC117340237 isoform X2 [Pecten maximus]XP_033757888.1 uncharacterized protein LOC117340237 isoform X2 [Pecten maximus]